MTNNELDKRLHEALGLCWHNAKVWWDVVGGESWVDHSDGKTEGLVWYSFECECGYKEGLSADGIVGPINSKTWDVERHTMFASGVSARRDILMHHHSSPRYSTSDDAMRPVLEELMARDLIEEYMFILSDSNCTIAQYLSCRAFTKLDSDKTPCGELFFVLADPYDKALAALRVLEGEGK